MDKIAIGSDHAGTELKEDVKAFLVGLGLDPVDFGTDGVASVDYPDFGIAVSEKVSSGELDRGILICGTGIGMSIVANKFKGVRAALVNDAFTAKMSREHKNANILVIGARVVDKGLVEEIVRTWIETKFEGGRHQKRLDKITAIEGK